MKIAKLLALGEIQEFIDLKLIEYIKDNKIIDKIKEDYLDIDLYGILIIVFGKGNVSKISEEIIFEEISGVRLTNTLQAFDYLVDVSLPEGRLITKRDLHEKIAMLKRLIIKQIKISIEAYKSEIKV